MIHRTARKAWGSPVLYHQFYPVKAHLDGDGDEEHAHETFHGVESPHAHDPVELRGEGKDDGRDSAGDQNGEEPSAQAFRLLGREEKHGGDG